MSWPQFYQRNRSVGVGSKVTDDDKRRRESTGCTSSALERVLCPDEARAIQRANQIVMYVKKKQANQVEAHPIGGG